MSRAEQAPAGGSGMKRETWLPATAASAQTARSIVRQAAAEAGLEGEAHVGPDARHDRSGQQRRATREGLAEPLRPVRDRAVPRGLRVEVCDLGTFDSALEPAPLEATSGRGVQIIAALVDRLEVRNGDGCTRVRFEKHRRLACAAGDHELQHSLPLRPATGIAAQAGGGA